MTTYRTRERDPKVHLWVKERRETRIGAKMARAAIEKPVAPCKVFAIERFELNPSKPELVRLLSELGQ